MRPDVAPPPAWHFPRAERATLSNGLPVLSYPMPGQHVISAAVVIDLPLSAEPRAKEGVSAMWLRILDEGTDLHPDTSYAEAIEDVGAAIDGSTGLSASRLYLDVPSPHLGPALDLFAEMLHSPSLAPEAVERHVGLRLAEIEQARANSAQLAGLAFRGQVFASDQRAARMNGGDTDTVPSLTADDVRAVHQSWCRPSRATLVLAGALPAHALDLAEAAFGSWTEPSEPTAGPTSHARLRGAGPRQRLIDRPGAVQADVRFGGFGIDRNDPRWPALQVGVHAVGGAFLSRLNRVLREERGYTYGVHLALHPHRHDGSHALQGSFRTDVVADALREARGILELSDPFHDEEIAAARTYLVGVTPLRFATAEGIVTQVAGALSEGRDPDAVDATLQAIRHVGPDEATRAYREVIGEALDSLVVVGDTSALTEPLRRAGFDAAP